MFRRLMSRSATPMVVDAGDSSSGSSSDAVAHDQIPILKRRHSSVIPYSESLFRTENDKTIELNEVSFDPFDHPSLRKSKSIAEGMADYNDESALKKKILKSVRFNKVEFEQELGIVPLEVSSDLALNESPFQTARAPRAPEKGSMFYSLGTSPQRSVSSFYSDNSDMEPKLEPPPSSSFRDFESMEQKQVTDLLQDLSKESFSDLEDPEKQQQHNRVSEISKSTDTENDQDTGTESDPISKDDMNFILSCFDSFTSKKLPISSDLSVFMSYLKAVAPEVKKMAAKKDLEVATLAAELEKATAIDNRQHQLSQTVSEVALQLSSLEVEETKVSERLQKLEDELTEYSTLLNVIGEYNKENTSPIQFVESLVNQNSYSTTQVQYLSTEMMELKEQKVKLQSQTTQAYKSNNLRSQQLNTTLIALKETIYKKDVEVGDMKSKLQNAEEYRSKLEEDLSSCTRDLGVLEAQLRKENSQSKSMKSRIKELQERCSSGNRMMTKLELASQTMQSSYEHELMLQTIQIKKLIAENEAFLSRLNEQGEELVQCKKLERSLKLTINNYKQANTLLSDNLSEVLRIIHTSMSQFIEPDSNKELEEILLIFSKTGKYGEDCSAQQFYACMVSFITKSIINLIDAFKRNEQLLELEIKNRNEGYQVMLHKLLAMMEENGLASSRVTRKIKRDWKQ